MTVFLIIFAVILILFITLPICYGLYLTRKWHKKGYNDTMESYKENKLGNVENPEYTKHSCTENRWWHYGAWDAYCEIKGIKE